MRHRVEGRKLKRTASHRKALLRALATQLLRHKRIKTTEAKAKEARRYTEAIITRAKRAYLAEQNGGAVDIHARREVARHINDGDVVQALFTEIAPKVANRPGGYTRVVKLGQRLGDGARVAILELVDYNVERDESASRSRSKRLMSRAERVARSRAKQEETAPKAAKGETPAAQPAEAPQASAVETPEVESAAVEMPAAEAQMEATNLQSEDVGENAPDAPEPEAHKESDPSADRSGEGNNPQ